jgi:DNA-directed RNA polymerase subunit M/transcription elongation factor TFIIS
MQQPGTTTAADQPVKKKRGRPPSSSTTTTTSKPKKNGGAAASAGGGGGGGGNETNVDAFFDFSASGQEFEASAASVAKPRRRMPSESLLEASKQIGYRGVSAGLHAEAIQRFGETTVQKLISVSCGDESIFYAYVLTFVAAGISDENPPPDNFATDHYWMLKPEDRVQMLDEAFAIVDDDAELAKVEPGPFKCKKCGSNRILQTERQLRSGDEAATQFFKCAGCKNRWIVH